MKQLMLALTILCWTGRAEAKCRLPTLELIWSYPAAGATDVPTNAELWVVVPWAWWNPVVRLDGRELAYTMSGDARGLVHVVPGALEANHDYLLQLDFTNVRPGEDAGVDALMEFSFRTGTQTAEAPPAPRLGAHATVEPQGMMVVPNGGCSDVIEAQDCIDTGPNKLETFEALGTPPLAWLVGERVLPARCEGPQVLRRNHERGGECIPVRAIGPGGLTSEPTLACIPSGPAPGETTASTDASTPASVSDTPSESRSESGCSTTTGNGQPTFMLLLALLLRRRLRAVTIRAATRRPPDVPG